MSERYGIAEWYGYDFASLSPASIRQMAGSPPKDCPFRFPKAPCNKPGGVCSMRLYSDEGSEVSVADNEIVTMCPNRFQAGGAIFSRVSEELIGTEKPHVVTEIPFLMAEQASEKSKPVGKIDMVLVNEDSMPMSWCALEIQAVYFSGKSMKREIATLRDWHGPGLPFPSETRRPDFRSSGPKRLMPQLQTKVPTLSRWGKKMAVVVDRSFWNAMAPMPIVKHVSNSDIAWFVADYCSKGRFALTIDEVVLTTLDSAVAGLTGGAPTSLQDFEDSLTKKMTRSGFQI